MKSTIKESNKKEGKNYLLNPIKTLKSNRETASYKPKVDLFVTEKDKYNVVKLQTKREDRKVKIMKEVQKRVKSNNLFKHNFKYNDQADIELFESKY
mmetsp:Transcript_29312/g.30422  ORF Transcript_29312/g.30422 Transcript_29312/m.30422 type:complete len:97 (-) Transcript_29312:29-319(-)